MEKREICRFLSVSLNGEPVAPGCVYGQSSVPAISLVASCIGKEIKWLKYGRRYVALQLVLRGISWNDLQANSLISGRQLDFPIEGQLYQCRLIRVGKNQKQSNEWEEFFAGLGANLKKDIENTMSWGMENTTQNRAAVRCGCGFKGWGDLELNFRGPQVGWRPVLEPVVPAMEELPVGVKLKIEGRYGSSPCTSIHGTLVQVTDYDLTLLVNDLKLRPCAWYHEFTPGLVTVDRSSIIRMSIV